MLKIIPPYGVPKVQVTPAAIAAVRIVFLIFVFEFPLIRLKHFVFMSC